MMLLAGAGLVIALAAPVATAQVPATATASQGQTITLTPEQKVIADAWAAEQQADYGSLPLEQQTWFWTLTPEQQTGFWALTPDQRGMIYRMTPEQQARAWDAVRAQLAGETPPTPPDQANPPGTGMPTDGVPNPDAAGQAVPPAMPADPSYQGGPYKGALTPPPADAMDKEYPVCSRTVTDNCQNPGEGGAKRGRRN